MSTISKPFYPTVSNFILVLHQSLDEVKKACLPNEVILCELNFTKMFLCYMYACHQHFGLKYIESD